MTARTRNQDNDSWLLTFADLMSLIACFFIIMYSTDNLKAIDQSSDKEKHHYENPMESFISPSQTYPENLKLLEDDKVSESLKQKVKDFDQRFISIKKDLLNFAGSQDLNLSTTQNKIIVSFEEGVFLNGSTSLNILFMNKIEKFVNALEIYKNNIKIDIEGHTDSKRIYGILKSKYPTNWELSSARAIKVLKYMKSLGIDRNTMRAIGYSDTKAVKNSGKNRSVKVVVYVLD